MILKDSLDSVRAMRVMITAKRNTALKCKGKGQGTEQLNGRHD